MINNLFDKGEYKIFIYGTGLFAERYFDSAHEIIERFPIELMGFIDTRSVGSDFKGYKIYRPEDISLVSYDCIYIFAYKKSYIEIFEKLTKAYGFDSNRIGNISDLLLVGQTYFRKNCISQKRTPYIYDCFTFFNELEVLRIRLETLSPYVDKFVLVEMDKDHHGKDKPYYFKEHESEFEEYRDKIICVHPDELPDWNFDYSGRWNWILEHFQRECIKLGLKKAQPEDIIVVSDCDEIPNPDVLKQIRDDFDNPYPSVIGKMLDDTSVALRQDYYYFYLNCHCVTRRNTTTITKFKNLISPQLIRDLMDCLAYIEKGGWHLTYFGGVDRIRAKMNSIVEGDYAPVSNDEILDRITKGKDIWGRKGQEFELEFLPKESLDFPNIDKWIKKYPHFFKEMV